MVYSMSGFGRANNFCKCNGGLCEEGASVEMRSVNSKGCEISVKCASRYGFLEEWARGIVREHLIRGKIDISIFIQGSGDSVLSVDYDVLDRFHSILSSVERRYRLRRARSAEFYLRQDGAIVHRRPEIDEQQIKKMVEAPLIAAIEDLKRMRSTEGAHLANDLLVKIDELEGLLLSIEERRPSMVEEKYCAMRMRIEKLIGEKADEQMLLQEIAIFADRVDIEEEVVRLRAHISHMRKLLKEDEVIGRKLDFISQELLREVNTIGSKSPDALIADLVISMKSVIDRIKEQVQNIL